MARQADIRFEQSTFGGGWAIPETPRGWRAARAVFGPPGRPAPLGGLAGYIVEPVEAGEWLDLAVTYDLVLRAPGGAIISRKACLAAN